MATKRWIGAAAAVAQVSKVTFSTYSAAETYTITINGKDVSFVSVTGTNSEIWAGLQAAWEATATAEITEAIATVDTGVVLTSRTPGQPFTVTADATTGTATVTPVTAATGPNHLMNADNWDGGVAPIAADDLLFAESAVDVLYELSPGVALGLITVEKSYTGRIGLARVSSSGYQEYRPRYFTLAAGATITIGLGSGNGSNRLLFDAATYAVTLDVYGAGQGEGFERPVQIKNTSVASVLSFYSGLAEVSGTGGAASLNCIARQNASAAPDVSVKSDSAVGVVLAAGNNAKLALEGSATSLVASDGVQVAIMGSGTCPTVSVSSGAIVYWDSSANVTTKLNVYSGGTASFARRNVARSVAACEVHSSGSLQDPYGTIDWTSGVLVVGLIGDVTLSLGRNVTVFTAALATGMEVLDIENADRDLTTAVTVLTHTPDPSGARICTGLIVLGDGTKDLDGTGGDFEVTVTIDGAAWDGGPETVTLGTTVKAFIHTDSFIVPAGNEVVIKVLSPNGADTDVDVTAYLLSEG